MEAEKGNTIGAKIRDLRLKNGLTQEELADRAELSKGFISQLENDLTSPSIATLTDIITLLGSSLGKFFSDFDDVQLVFTPDDYFEKRTDDHSSSIINCLRGGTLLLISVVVTSSASTLSLMEICASTLLPGSSVVSQSCSASISPRPL